RVAELGAGPVDQRALIRQLPREPVRAPRLGRAPALGRHQRPLHRRPDARGGKQPGERARDQPTDEKCHDPDGAQAHAPAYYPAVQVAVKIIVWSPVISMGCAPTAGPWSRRIAPHGNPGRVPEPSRGGTRRAKLAGSPRDLQIILKILVAAGRRARKS